MSSERNERPSPIEVQKHLSGIDYPAAKEDLLRAAREQNAPRGVLDVLERIEEREYDGPAEVSEAVGKA